MTKTWPSSSRRRSASWRPTTSLVPPGGYGTTSVTGLFGQSAPAAWAPALNGTAAIAAIAQASAKTFKRIRTSCLLQQQDLGSHSGHGRGRRAHRAGQAQRRRSQQKGRALVGTQPLRELGEVPQLAQVQAELEQAVRMQRQARVMLALAGLGRIGLDREVVGADRDDSRVGDPLHQLPVAP